MSRIIEAIACTGVGLAVLLAPCVPTAAARALPGASPGGELAVVSNSNDYGSDGTVTFAITAPDGHPQRTLSAGTNAYVAFPTFAAGGREIAYIGDNGSSGGPRVRDLATGRVTSLYSEANTGLVFTGLTVVGSSVVYGENLGSGGQPTAMPGLWSVPATGGTPKLISADDGTWYPMRAPGDHILYVVMGNQPGAGGSAVWEMNADGSDNHRLFSEGFQINLPSVSPDGQLIAFDRTYNATTANIEEVHVNGTGLRALTPEVSGHNDADPTWSPDGRELAFISARTGRDEGSPGDQLFDGYEMTSTGADVHAVISDHGSSAGLDYLTWGP